MSAPPAVLCAQSKKAGGGKKSPKASNLSEDEVAEYRAAFEEFDKDNSGTISIKELSKAFKDMGIKKKESEIRGEGEKCKHLWLQMWICSRFRDSWGH